MCPLCNSTEFKSTGLAATDSESSKVIPNDYNIVKCLNCNFYFLDPPLELTDEEWKYLYDSSYFFELTKSHFKRRGKDKKKRLDRLIKFNDCKMGNFLDIGCGEGFVLLEALKLGWKTYGLDISDNRMPEAKLTEINFLNSDVLSAKFPDDFFDCVYMDSVLEHVTNQMSVLKEINRISKKGALLYIAVPNEDCLKNDVVKIVKLITGKGKTSSKFKPFQYPYHVVGFNMKSLKFVVDKANYKTEKLRNFAMRNVFLTAKFPSRNFFILFILTIINYIAVPLRREYYLEMYARKK
jgi:ubiquinone/menaquinone biosynthesis C-methylase UbiE